MNSFCLGYQVYHGTVNNIPLLCFWCLWEQQFWKLFIYQYLFMWPCWVLVATCGIFLCGSQISLLLWWEGSRACGLQLQHQSFQWIFRTDFLEDRLVGSPCCPRDSQESFLQHHNSKTSVLQCLAFFMVLLSIHNDWTIFSPTSYVWRFQFLYIFANTYFWFFNW